MNVEEFNQNFETCIIENLSFADYLKVDAVSNSAMEDFSVSPAHYKYFREHPKYDTEATDFGSLVHCAILEPKELFKRYRERPADYDGRKTKSKELKAKWDAEGVKGVDSEDLIFAQEIAKKIFALKDLNLGTLIETSISEVSFFWEKDGVRKKGRADKYSSQAGGICTDIKTTRHPEINEFEKEVFNRGYHRKAAHYKEGLEANGCPCKHSLFIAIDNNVGPRDFIPYLMLPEIVELGAKQNDRLIAKFKECKAKNEWPCFPKQILELGLPSWAINKLTDEDLI